MKNLKNLKAYNEEQKKKLGHRTKCNRTSTKRTSASKEQITGQVQKTRQDGKKAVWKMKKQRTVYTLTMSTTKPMTHNPQTLRVIN